MDICKANAPQISFFLDYSKDFDTPYIQEREKSGIEKAGSKRQGE